jgi:ABC-2 type transport system permease protein
MMMLFTALTVGLMNIFLVVRYTRTDEEKGRYEVVRSLPVGRLANINATMIVVLIVNIILSIVIALGMFALGDESMCFNGSVLWGVSLGVTGLVFAALAAIFSQLSASARGATGYSFMALAVFYLMRAPGDMNADMEILSLISPLGLILRAQAYMENHWWPVLVMLGIAVVFTIIAYRLNFSRDIDQGIIPAKPGRAHGSALMRSSSGLAFRLLKVSLIVWIIGMFMLGASYASILGEVDTFIAENEMYQQLILGPAGIELETAEETGQVIARLNGEVFQVLENRDEIAELMKSVVSHAGFTITELFASMVNSMMGMVVLVPLLMFILKVKGEEKDIRAELILAASVSRKKYLAGYAIIAFASAVIMQFILALGLYSVAASVLADPSELSFGFLLRANLVYVPAQWVVVGVAILLIGLLPKAAGAIWGYFAYTFLIIFIGRVGIFPEFLSKLTPIGFVPQLPMDEINVAAMILLTVVAAVLTAAGFVFYSRRDINAITH